MTIDLNADVGEGLDNDDLLMPFLTSANIACGTHAGNEDIMKRTVDRAMNYKVALGAHPGFADRQNFGRKEIILNSDEYYDLITQQVYFLQKIVNTCGGTLHHVKPHGALYNMAARDRLLASIIAKAIFDVDPTLMMYGLSGSHLITEAVNAGLSVANEVFADRTYQDNGALTPRSSSQAMIDDSDLSVQQVLLMIFDKKVTTVNGKQLAIQADTICIHGDGPHAVTFAETINLKLKEHSIVLTRPQKIIA